MPSFTSSLRKTRVQLGLSQLDLAARADLSPRTIQIAESGKEVSTRTLSAISDALEVPSDQLIRIDPAINEIIHDGFLDMPWRAGDDLRKGRLPHGGDTCRDETEVREVIERMHRSFQSQIDRSGNETEQRLCRQRFDQLAANGSGLSERYVDIWKTHPDALRVDRADGDVYAVSIVLPLRQDVFDGFIEGRLDYSEIDGACLTERSQHLLLDSVTEFSDQRERFWHRITHSLSFITLNQIAMLSSAPERSDFEMASFYASPINLRRLTSVGFESMRTIQPISQYPICYFGQERKCRENDDTYANATTLTHFAHLAQRLRNANFRQMMARALLAGVKRRQNAQQHRAAMAG
ncbi:MAG: helix-turn-helix domain-containing protein [Planctomycetota bacterium]